MKKNNIYNLSNTIAELLDYSDLLYFMISREIKVLYKQTVMGFSWAIIRPLTSMIIFSIIFGRLAKVPSDGIPYPVFSYTALVPWIYFSTAFGKSANSLISNSAMISKIYFPRLIIPLTPLFAGIIDFLIALVMLIFIMFYYSIAPTINIIWLPFLVLLMFLSAGGVGMWFSALSIQFRDIRHAIQFITQLLMYLAPVVWPASLVAEKFGNDILYLYAIYPMVGVIEGFRACLIGVNPMPWDLIVIASASSTFLFFSGLMYFQNRESIFADVA
jgi:lipopolysaccharide transport system permease protein